MSNASDALEWVLLVASLAGILHHASNLRFLSRRCSGALPWSEVILCRLYKRHERVRILVKVALAVIAVWLISQPMRPIDGLWDESGVLFLRVALVGIALALDWESIKAKSDRDEIGRRDRVRGE